MKKTSWRAILALLVAALAAGPVSAREAPGQAAPVVTEAPTLPGPGQLGTLSGKVTRCPDGALALQVGAATYRLEGETARALAPLVGRTIRVEAAIDRAPPPPATEPRAGQAPTTTPIDAALGGGAPTLEVLSYVDPRPASTSGVVGEQDEVPTLDTPEGIVRLGGVPPALLSQLGGRRLSVTGWIFKDEGGHARELVLTSVAAQVVQDGWLSQRIEDPVGSGTWRYRTTANVKPGDNVTLVELGAYNKTEKAWRSVEDTRPGDILFGVVRLGAPRPGEPALEGWIPIYKLSLGVSVPTARAEEEPTVADADAVDSDAADAVDDVEVPVQATVPGAQQAPAGPTQVGATGVLERALGQK